jgi:hypothetical protein
MSKAGSELVLVQVVEVEGRREIGWGVNLAEQLAVRLADVRTGIAAGVKAIAHSLEGLPSGNGWQPAEVSASFGVTLTAEAGVIVSRASAGATFEVTVKYQQPE